MLICFYSFFYFALNALSFQSFIQTYVEWVEMCKTISGDINALF